MHRTFSVPCLIGWASLFALLTLFVAVPSAAAQGPLHPVSFAQAEIQQTAVPITIAVGARQIYTAKNNLKKVENPNARVLNVTEVKGDPKSVWLEGVGAGRTTVTAIDDKNNKEVFEIIVISDRVKELRESIARAVPTAAVSVNSTDSGATIILSGYVLTSDDAKVVQQLAGPGVINNVKIGGVQQVQIEVIVATVDRSKARTMEFSWMVNGNNWFMSSILNGFSPYTVASIFQPIGATAGNGFTSQINPVPGTNGAFGVLSPGGASSILGFLQLLRTESLSKVLAEPRVTTMSGQWGYIVSGGEVPLILPTGVGAPPSISYKQFGTIVQFRPIVKGNGKIYLQVRSELSQVDTALSASIAGASAPGFQLRSAQVEVEMDEGQTLAIGGLIQNSVTASITRVPVLGDIPGLGVLFSSKNFTDTEEELVILVTPRLVDPVDCTKIPKYYPGRETRSPDDFELFLEGILEAPRGPRNVIFHPSYYKPAFQNAPNAGQIPCGGGSSYGSFGGGCANGNCGVPNSGATARPAAYNGPASMPTVTTTSPAPMPPMTMPSPRFPDVPAQPTTNSRIIVQPDVPMMPMPPIRIEQPSLGTPTLPPARDFDNRPLLPPVTPGLEGPR